MGWPCGLCSVIFQPSNVNFLLSWSIKCSSAEFASDSLDSHPTSDLRPQTPSLPSPPDQPSLPDPGMKSIRLASQFSSITRRWLYTLCPSRMTRPVCSMLLWPFSILRDPFSGSLSFHSLFKCCIKCHSWVSPLSQEGRRSGKDTGTGTRTWTGVVGGQRWLFGPLLFKLASLVRAFDDIRWSSTSFCNGLFEIFQAAAYL